MRSLLLALIWFYQNILSPLMPSVCRFTPSCSQYAKESLMQHGAFKGTILALWRILRCNPFCHGGIDPVPAVWPTEQLKARIIPWTSRRKSVL
ncbi:MAG: membrane protein insertion efficiency factor YidD [Pseudodesulfovibrio sp.]